MAIEYVADYLVDGKNLTWGLPVLIPLLLFVYSPFIIALIGLILYFRARAIKKHMEAAKTVLLISTFFLLWFVALMMGLIRIVSFSPSFPLEITHLILTTIIALIGLILYFRARAIKKHMEAAKTVIIVSSILLGLYAVQIIGFIGSIGSTSS